MIANYQDHINRLPPSSKEQFGNRAKQRSRLLTGMSYQQIGAAPWTDQAIADTMIRHSLDATAKEDKKPAVPKQSPQAKSRFSLAVKQKQQQQPKPDNESNLLYVPSLHGQTSSMFGQLYGKRRSAATTQEGPPVFYQPNISPSLSNRNSAQIISNRNLHSSHEIGNRRSISPQRITRNLKIRVPPEQNFKTRASQDNGDLANYFWATNERQGSRDVD